MPPSLDNFDVLSFDCYGTLIDWETGIWDALQPLLMRNRVTHLARPEALTRYARIEAAVETEDPSALYSTVLETVHRRLAEDLQLSTTLGMDRDFGHSIGLWPAFPDTADALRKLQTRYRLVILSNVHEEGFAASNRKLGVAFDRVFTAEAIGSYKPSRENFEYLVENLGIDPARILHTAQSLYHDHVPAKEFGLATAWVDRQRLSTGGEWGATAPVENAPEPDFVFFTLAEMAAATIPT